jgi:pimeloyl-ACP methyl ester carboxylesterase
MTVTPDTVATRCVVFFGGYEHASAKQQYGRFVREIGRFEHTWNLVSAVGEPAADIGPSVQLWPIETKGPNWAVETRFHYYSWNDLIEEDFARPDWRSIPAGLAALLDFIVTGTALRYVIVAWRYWLFSFYPFALSVLFAAVATLFVLVVAWLGAPMPWYLAIPVGIAVFWGLAHWPGNQLRYRYMLNDWSFASAIAWGRRRSYRERLAAFAEALCKTIRETDADEVLIVGHSLGAVLAVETLAAALQRDPDLAGAGRPVTLMTVGSSLLKVALHPAARGLRRSIKRVLGAVDVAWIDYTALVDPLNFYRTDPGRVLGLKASRAPVIRTAKIRAMLGEDAYKRFKGDFLRLHRQFVMGNGARYHYDFFMACCGPMSQAARIADMTASIDNFAEDGSYRPIEADRESPVKAASGPSR